MSDDIQDLIEATAFVEADDEYSIWAYATQIDQIDVTVQMIPVSYLQDQEAMVVVIPKAAWGRPLKFRCIPKTQVLKSDQVSLQADLAPGRDAVDASAVDAVLLTVKLTVLSSCSIATSVSVYDHQFKDDLDLPTTIQPGPLRALLTPDEEFHSGLEPAVATSQDARISSLEKNVTTIGTTLTEVRGLLISQSARDSSGSPATPGPTKVLRKPAPTKKVFLEETVQTEMAQLGLTEDQMIRLSTLLAPKPALPRERVPAKQDLLGETEDEVEVGSDGVDEDPMVKCLKKLTAISEKLCGTQKATMDPVEKLLGGFGERATGIETSTALSISKGPASARRLRQLAFIEKPEWFCELTEDLMRDANRTSTTVQNIADKPCPYFYLEHRSRLQNYDTSINLAYMFAGIIAALQRDRPAEALARAYASLGSLEQFSMDGGTWLVAIELAMIEEPPYAAYANRSMAQGSRVGRSLTHPKIVDPRIHEIFQAKIKAVEEAFDRKKRMTAKKVEEAPKQGR